MAETSIIQPNTNNQVVIPKQQNKPLEADKEVVENQNEIEQDEVILVNKKQEIEIKRSAKGPMYLAWGLLKGVVKETFSILGFFANFIIHPIESVKGLVSGIAMLGKLISNPALLKETIRSGWESFKQADAEEKGEILGRLLFNFTPAASLMNVRLLSQLNRFTTGLTAIAKEAKHLKTVYKQVDFKSTLREVKIIARKANVEKDFRKALKMEGIPDELAPKLVYADLPDGVSGAFIPEEYIVYINKASLENRFSFSLGKTVRHEVKHVSQVLSLAKSGTPIPRKPTNSFINQIFNEKGSLQERVQLQKIRESLRLDLEKKYNVAMKFDEQMIPYIHREFPNGVPLIPDSIVEMAKSHLHLKVRSNVKPENMAQAFKEASRYQKKFRGAREYKTFENIMGRVFASKQVSIEELTSKMTRSVTSFEKGREVGKLRAIKKAKVPAIRFVRVVKFTFPLVKEGFGQWVTKISTNRKRYLNNAIEKEAWAVQGLYTGLAPRFHTPAIHNISKLSSLEEKESIEVGVKSEDKGIVLNSAA